MKKSILLATTAIISAFALNARAASYNTNVSVDLEGKAILVNPIVATSVTKLDFGIIAGKRSDSTSVYTIDNSGNITTEGAYAQTFGGNVRAGKIKIDAGAGAYASYYDKFTLLLPSAIPLKHDGDAECGNITNLTQAPVSFSSGTYSISFGGKFTPTATVSSPAGQLICEGSAEATLVYTE